MEMSIMPEHQQMQQSKIADTTSQKQTIPHQIPKSHPPAIIQCARINPKSLTPSDVLQLQRTIGNRTVGRQLSEIGLIPSKAKQASPVQIQKTPEEEKESLEGKMAETIQRQEIPEEEEPLQGKMIETFQKQEILEEEEHLQMKRENNNRMPDNLKAGVENLSGLSMDNVRVHYNSDKPAQVGALAYTQGTDIHVAPRQEKHLPHEAWHVVQQAQGRVQPTTQMQGVNVNDDVGLEKEADEMGSKAIQMIVDKTVQKAEICKEKKDVKVLERKILGTMTNRTIQLNGGSKIVSETIFMAPDGSEKSRNDVGVGERVNLKSTIVGNWSATKGKLPENENTNNCVWTAPEEASNVTITLNVQEKPIEIQFNVLEPKNVIGTKIMEYTATELGITEDDIAGAGMEIELRYEPNNVSFGNLEVMEEGVAATNVTGYYEKIRGNTTNTDLYHENEGIFSKVKEDNIDTGLDEATTVERIKPYDDGTFDWDIPYIYRVQGNRRKHKKFNTVKQSIRISKDGTIIISKAGVEVRRTPTPKKNDDSTPSQLKRVPLQKISHSANINQRSWMQPQSSPADAMVLQKTPDRVTDYFKEVITQQPKELYVYTHVMKDGLGDAGQVGFLFKKLESKKNELKVGEIKSHITIDAPTPLKGVHSRVELSKTLSYTKQEPYICDDENRDQVRNNIPPKNDDNLWEIQYPVPAGKDAAHILKIKEMGLATQEMEKAGELYGGLGYGIPHIEEAPEKNLSSALYALAKEIGKTDEGETKTVEKLLSDAWLVSVKEYLYSSTYSMNNNIDIKRIMKIAKTNGASLLILIDKTPKQEKYEDMPVISGFFDSKALRYIMNNIISGVIISGGEGLYAESLGTKEKGLDRMPLVSSPGIPSTTSSVVVIAGRYEFQYREIADALIKRETLNGVSKKDALDYQIARRNNDIVLVNQREEKKICEALNGISDDKYYCSKSLSALYLPLSVNGRDEISMPPVFSSFELVKEIFRDEKRRLQKKNWFELIDKVII
jgi:hypothetical protein